MKRKTNITCHFYIRAVNFGNALPEVLYSGFESLALSLLYCIQIIKRKMQNKQNIYVQMSINYMFVIYLFITKGDGT